MLRNGETGDWIVDTPMVEKSKLDEDKEGKAINPSHYRGIIGTLLYVTDSSITLTAFADADHAGCQDTRHNTSGSMQFLGDRLALLNLSGVLFQSHGGRDISSLVSMHHLSPHGEVL
nr:hypothetical protein [Tanacetum cinerariifolium]